MRQERKESIEIRKDASSDRSRLAATTPRIVMRKGAQEEVPPLSEIPQPIGIREDRQSEPEPSSAEPRFTETHRDAPRGLLILTDAQRPTATLSGARLELQQEATEALRIEEPVDSATEQSDKRKTVFMIYACQTNS